MKKLLAFTIAATILSATSAFACPGGNLIQVIHRDRNSGMDVVIVNYDISTGKMVSQNRSVTINSIVSIATGDDKEKENMCANENCTALVEMRNRDIRISYSYISGQKEINATKTLRGVSTGVTVPVAKDMPKQGDIVPDMYNNPIYKCSKK